MKRFTIKPYGRMRNTNVRGISFLCNKVALTEINVYVRFVRLHFPGSRKVLSSLCFDKSSYDSKPASTLRGPSSVSYWSVHMSDSCKVSKRQDVTPGVLTVPLIPPAWPFASCPVGGTVLWNLAHGGNGRLFAFTAPCRRSIGPSCYTSRVEAHGRKQQHPTTMSPIAA